MEHTKNVTKVAGAPSALNDRLEHLIDGDVTCWGIDDVIAYGKKVAAMEREECAMACTDYALSYPFDESWRDIIYEVGDYIRTGKLPENDEV